MAISAATLRVDVDMNTGAAERQLTGFGQKLSGFAAGAARAGSAMFTGLAMGAGIALFNGIVSSAGNAVSSLGDAVAAASNLSETVNMMTVVMGRGADAVMAWSQNSAKALGMTQNQALTAAGTFAAFGKAANMAGDELTGFSTDLVGLAADLGSFYNTSPEEAITAIGAALRGESEPIRRYNVLLDDMTLRQAAVKLGIIETTKEALTPQQRVLAATSELWRQTGDAQGDFARTSGGLAGQQKILTANMDALSVTIGNALLPAMTAWTQVGNTLVTAILPSMGNLITTYVVPAMTDLATAVAEAGRDFGFFLDAIKQGADPVGAFIDQFDLEPIANDINQMITVYEGWVNVAISAYDQMRFGMEDLASNFVLGVNVVIESINAGIGVYEGWVNVAITAFDQMRWSMDGWARSFVVAINTVIVAINAVIVALADLDAKQRVVAGGMALITGNVGAAYNLLMTKATAFAAIPLMTVPSLSPQTPTSPYSAGGFEAMNVPGAGHVPTAPFAANTIATSFWGAAGGPGVFDAGTGWGAGSAAREAADKAAAAAATAAAEGLKGTFSASTIAANSIGNLGSAAGAAASAADELETALRGVPGLFGTSSVTSGDMAKAAAGLPVNFADDYVRRVGDELLNGVNLADIDPAEVAASLGMDPSVPAQLIYNELVRQWGSGEYFANPDNVAKINWEAVQAKIDQDARAVLGESNILAGAIAAGITLESMAPVATATVAGMTGALAESNLGAATGATAIAAMATPEAIKGFEESGVSAASSWMNGWHTAVDGWIPPMPATTTTPLVENPFGPPAVPITVDSFASPGPGRPVPGSRSGTASGGNVWNITINGVDASKAGAVGNAAKNAVLDALRARGQV